MDPAIERFRVDRPDLAARLRLHETGRAIPSLDGVDTVVFWLADPLRERYPECHREAGAIEAEARRRGARVVNAPASLSNSRKSRQAELWREAGVDTPPVVRCDDVGQLRVAAQTVGYPLVIRGDEVHGQQGLRVVHGESDLETLDPASLRFPAAASPLWDVRASWRERDPESPYARRHHKKRAYVLLDRVCSEHVFFAHDPVVTARTCTFAAPAAGWRARLLAPFLARAELTEDRAYWRSPNPHEEALLEAAAVLGLEYAAIDYSERADGSLVLWEANPYPFLPPASQILLPRRRRARDRLAHYHGAIAGFLARCLDPTPSTRADRLRRAPSPA